MSLSFGRRLVVSAAAVLGLGLGASGFADFLLDDLEHGKNGPNKLKQYWYIYDDFSILTNKASTLKAIAGGNAGSDWCVGMEYNSTLGSSTNAGNYATVGLGTGISASESVGYGDEFSGVTGFEFYVKGPVGLTYRFIAETSDKKTVPIPDDMYNANGVTNTITSGDWHKVTVKFADADWGPEGDWGTAFTFKNTNITKLAWQLKSQANTAVTAAGSLLVDDVTILGAFEGPTGPPPRPAYAFCTACIQTTYGAPSPSRLFSDFEAAGAAAGKTTLDTYWSTYRNTASTTTPTGTSPVYAATGRDGGGGASVDFTIGGESSEAYVGLSVDLGSTTVPFNGGNFTGIYFEYNTSTKIDAVKVGLLETAGVTTPNGTDFHTYLQGTGGTWKAAIIKFAPGTDGFVLPDWAPARTLNLADLVRLQFGFYDTVDVSGTIAVDNVYFLGDDRYSGETGVRHVGHAASTFGIRATYSRGVVGVNWSPASPVADGKISLVNTKGRVVASSRIAKGAGNRVTATLGAAKLPTGMYFVRVNAKGVDGKRVVQNVAVSIVK